MELKRIRRFEDIPPTDERRIDVVILDMNHDWPNLGHDCVVRIVGDIADSLRPRLDAQGLQVRVLSYEVRKRHMVPEPPGPRFSLYLGTGGPGHLDPRMNDGQSEGSQGIREDGSWEAPLFRLIDSIRGNPQGALLAVCHSFGVLCRWASVARAVLRGPEKKGKSAGVTENILTEEAIRHPWFSRFAAALPETRRHAILDNRLFDLVPAVSSWPEGVTPIAFELRERDGKAGDALTMLELARDPAGGMPRIFGVNHHPEILDAKRLLRILDRKFTRGEVGRSWYEERLRTLEQASSGEEVERSLRLTAHYTFVAPLKYYLIRQLRLRAVSLGLPALLNEEEVLGERSAAFS